MSELYIDEKHKNPLPPEFDGEGGDWGGSYAPGGSGGDWGGGIGSWGGGGGGGIGGGAVVEYPSTIPGQEVWHIILSADMKTSLYQMLTDGDGRLLLNDSGCILTGGETGCIEILVECQIKGDASGDHVRCLLLSFVLETEDASSEFDSNTLLENLTNLPDGKIRIRAKWQTGHYDYSKYHTVRFRIGGENGKVTAWEKLPMGNYIDIIELKIKYGRLGV